MKPVAQRRPLSGSGPVILQRATDTRWVELALERFDELLIDHAHCEKKAAANALSMLQAYPEIPELPMQMAQLAREESTHLARVLAVMKERGLTLGKDTGDAYAQQLQTLGRKTQPERKIDRLLIAAVIEARSCERLGLLADALPPGPLQKLYAELAQSEDGHQKLFFDFAVVSSDEDSVRARLQFLLEAEARLLHRHGIRPTIHG